MANEHVQLTHSERVSEQGCYRRARRREDFRGSVVVEAAIILPLFLMLVLGAFSGADIYNKDLSLTHAAREGARYGALLQRATTSFASNACSGGGAGSWATSVQSTVVARSAGQLTCGQVCVALVSGNPGSEAVMTTGSGTSVSTTGNPCYADASGTDSGSRVQVKVDRGANNSADSINALFFSVPVHLQSQATGSYVAPS